MSKTIFMIHENGNATLQEDGNVIREVGASSGLFEAMADFNKMMKKRNLSYRLTSSFTELLTGCGLKDNIAIVGLHISPTYRGLLCGIPDEEMNKEYVSDGVCCSAKDHAKSSGNGGWQNISISEASKLYNFCKSGNI
jgi:hypothetical protein